MRIQPLDLKTPIKLITIFSDFCSIMDEIDREKPVCAFDYETSSLKPQGKNRRIWSMSICSGDTSYSFPVHYPKIPGKFPTDVRGTFWGREYLPDIIECITRFLEDPEIYKIAQGTPFERIWSYFVFGVPVENLSWCTMQNQHILDSRKEFTGLKFQAFVRWGVHGYEEEVDKYLKKCVSKNDLNELYKMPLEQLLEYGGIDSYLTRKLAGEQAEVFRFGNNKPLNIARRLFQETSIAFTNCQKTGICIGVGYYKKWSNKLQGAIDKLQYKVLESPASKKFEELQERPFKLSSPKDLRILLFDILEEKPGKPTPTGLQSVDKEVLASLKTPIGRQIVKIREFEKLRNTYIAQYLREEVNGRIYPFFHTHYARSGRSSSSDPNFQNLPIRDEKAKKIIRSGILPSPGNKIGEIDFKAIEVCILGCETKDETLLKYLGSPRSDMHYDQAKKLFILNDDEMNDALRYNAKSDFVFLEFYGGDAASSATYLWHDSVDIKLGPNSDGPKLLAHFFDQGIRNLDDYIEHVREVEKDFWRDYPGVKAWQKEQCKFYLDNGYVETHFGFRRSGYLTQNAILNTRIQSTAAHLLWWCFQKLDKIRIKEQWKTKFLGQIHDSKVPDIYPPEEEHVLKTAYQVMTVDTKKAFKWLIVPIDIEIELGEIDQSWYDIKEISEDYYKKLRPLTKHSSGA